MQYQRQTPGSHMGSPTLQHTGTENEASYVQMNRSRLLNGF